MVLSGWGSSKLDPVILITSIHLKRASEKGGGGHAKFPHKFHPFPTHFMCHVPQVTTLGALGALGLTSGSPDKDVPGSSLRVAKEVHFKGRDAQNQLNQKDPVAK